LTQEETEFFESKIRPALVEYCYQCHSADEKIKGGLRVDNLESLLIGGDSGHAIVPGNLRDSLFYTAITWADDDYEMPPKRKMPSHIIEDFKKWIEMGAPDPRVPEERIVTTEINIEQGKEFWAFQKPKATEPAAMSNSSWAVSDVDRFIAEKLGEHGLDPAPDADPATLLRRLYFDIVGLPPSPEEVNAYAKAWKEDPEAAYSAKVDELLASPQFGERWGRHWLDVARYAESTGKEVNMTYPNAWRYRDYVIDSFNADKPYDEFVTEQIAGDLMKAKNEEDWQENLVATGFLALGTKGLNERDPRQFALDLADEQIDATSQAVLGLTIACARCHDHKADPIPTTDYYSMAAIFQGTKTYFGTVNAGVVQRASKLLELPIPDENPQSSVGPEILARLKDRLASTQADLDETQAENRRAAIAARTNGTPPPTNNINAILRLRTQVAVIESQLGTLDEDGNSKTLAMGVQDQARPTTSTRVLVRGEIDKPGQTVPRGFLQVLNDVEPEAKMPADSSGRLELAQWMTSKDNPLTARVMANRIWGHLFGKALVSTPNNFGASGKKPSHPELLDHLALEFMANGWSVKSLIRELVHSRTYRMSSKFDSYNYGVDPDNDYFWRMSARRLEAEVLRDAILASSGRLDTERPHGSKISEIGDTVIGRRTQPEQINEPTNHRSVYLPIVRDALPEALDLFDVADPSIVTGSRDATNIPTQALYLMNNDFVIQQAEWMARRIIEEAESDRDRFTLAFLIAYGRPPTKAEIDASTNFFREFRPEAERRSGRRDNAAFLAFSTFCQSLLASAEFRYIN
ncbi:MAG: PSD1 and planctomycete cytochrome C domain-containing protein, partial [Verrucomicrobiota bacterium]